MSPSPELLAWRICGCSIVVWCVILCRGRLAPRRAFTLKTVGLIIGASLLISFNWGLFIWAVAADKILEAGLGYYINPLVNVVLGMIFFSEKLGPMRAIALALASAGVAVITLAAGVFPWFSIVLACTFAFYGLLVKQLPADFDSVEILGWVTTIIGPLSGLLLVVMGVRGEWHIVGFGTPTTILLVFAGMATFLPLWLFGVGARNLPLGVLGFLQYIAPSLMVLIGVLVYGEPFGFTRGAAFFLVALALGFYSSTLRRIPETG